MTKSERISLMKKIASKYGLDPNQFDDQIGSDRSLDEDWDGDAEISEFQAIVREKEIHL